MMIDVDEKCGLNTRTSIGTERNHVVDKGKQVAPDDDKTLDIVLIDSSDQHPILFGEEIIRTDSPMLGVLKTKPPRVPSEPMKQVDLQHCQDKKKIKKKKEPPMAVRQSSRIRRDGVPISVKAQQFMDHMNDISGFSVAY
ncbi:hypothetical protein ABZP36_007291 [Zizania latifolia]